MYDIEKHRCEVVTSAAPMDGFYIYGAVQHPTL